MLSGLWTVMIAARLIGLYFMVSLGGSRVRGVLSALRSREFYASCRHKAVRGGRPYERWSVRDFLRELYERLVTRVS